jgi:protoheme ferro-lyase
VRDLAHARPSRAPVRVAPALSAEALAEASAVHVRDLVRARPGWSGDRVALVLAAHGTVIAPARPIDTGLEATEALCSAIRHRLSSEFGLIVNGWLNHTRGGRWTEPPIDEALRQVVVAGFTKAVYFPFGFLADNAESQLEGRLALRAQPDLNGLHLPCLNESAHLINALARQVIASDGARGL